ncbi:MAG: DEAD/DEAH box helicase family protein [Rhodospirillales bacterium]|nr:DEAD/DEAH box helicase family protein [Rhodospirillales bacterium]
MDGLTAQIDHTSDSALSLSSLKLLSEYRTGQSNMLNDFYLPCFRSSASYDRAVGYFRSSIFLLVNSEIPNFVERNGRIRIVCSPSLTESDISALKKGYEMKEQVVQNALLKEIKEFIASEDIKERAEALATLVALNVLDIKIAFREETMGMYHEKLGVFTDETGNAVSFKGSSNETWNGWHESGNFESIEVFCSWVHKDADRVEKHQHFFEDLWEGRAKGIQTYKFPEALKKELCKIAKTDLDKIDWKRFTKVEVKKEARKPFPHQSEAIENWKAAGCRGILEHATGSGKTFTAIVALREHLAEGNTALVVVPSKLLLRQWVKELKDELPDATILKAGDGNVRWKKKGLLKDFTFPDKNLKPRIVVSTMQTASSDLFLKGLYEGEHLMLVADEVHQSGSPENSKLYTINAGKRLGLSATPIRYGDPEGTQRMMDYFGGIVKPVFSLFDAIKSGRLVEYEYYPRAINLTAEEAEEWKALSIQIIREVARSPEDGQGNKKISDRAKMLLIQRSRIAKKAKMKVDLAERILRDEYQEGEKWLVYCEDKTQLGEVLERIKALKLHVNEYHTSMESDMDATLAWYRKHGGILVSIRCLDEGVDIPDISHALILASSQNPRQFIQRRGRVLRRSPGKHFAVLHDAIVVPVDAENESDQMPLVKSEFCRAIEFAEGAINKSSSIELMRIAEDLGLDINDLSNKGQEEEQNDE